MGVVMEEPGVIDRSSRLVREKLKLLAALYARTGIKIKHRAVRNRLRISLLLFRATARSPKLRLSSNAWGRLGQHPHKVRIAVVKRFHALRPNPALHLSLRIAFAIQVLHAWRLGGDALHDPDRVLGG